MDSRCAQLLPAVCAVLSRAAAPALEETCLEKLLDWLESLQGPRLLLLEENPCLARMVRAVLLQPQPRPDILGFVLRLTGLLAASEEAFQRLQQEDVVRQAFGEAGPRGGPLWGEPAVRRGWLQGLHSALQHRSALQLFCQDSGALEVVFALQGDQSLFVSSGASRLLAQALILSVRLESPGPCSAKDCDWPVCARRILAQVEGSLQSRSAPLVQQALRVLTTLFERCQDEWTGALWARIAETVETLLEEGESQAGHALLDLLLSMARSPAFRRQECSLWKVIAIALKCSSPAQTSPLALGLLKLQAGPQATTSQSLNVLLQPMVCILTATSHSTDFSGLLCCGPPVASAMEPLLSSRSSCISLLCQTLTHLEEIQHLVLLSTEFPPQPLLRAVVRVLQLCIGLAVPVSPLGVTLGTMLVGAFRVQRAALSFLGALSPWASRYGAMEEATNILLVYLKSPDSSPTVLKKAFHAMLAWWQIFEESSGFTEDSQWCRQFLEGLLPVVQKRMCSPSWEVRDSALEFLIEMAEMAECWRGNGQECFWEVFSSSETRAVVESLLDDPESYVRASAVKAVGKFSYMASRYSKTAGADHNGSDKEASVAARLLEILSTDSEGFPRRAVIRVFAGWLRGGHPAVLTDPEGFVAQVIHVVNRDLDWEVKVSGLELVDDFAAQTLGFSCRAAVDPPPEALQTFCRLRLFEFLFGALGDCDRPVALKACKVLMAIKAKMCNNRSLQQRQGSGLDDSCLLEETLERVASAIPSEGLVPQDPAHILLILQSLNLERLQRWLDRSSDSLENSPQSLLQDILSARGDEEDQEADCY